MFAGEGNMQTLEQDVITLKAKINSINQDLGSKQFEFQKKMKELADLEKVGETLKEKLKTKVEIVTTEFLQLKKEYRAILLNSSNPDLAPETLLSRKLLANKMLERINLLGGEFSKIKIVQSQITDLDQRQNFVRRNLSTLQEVLLSLEKNKSHYGKNYQEKYQDSELINAQKVNVELAAKAEHLNVMSEKILSLPATGIKKMEVLAKGVNLFITDQTQLLSPGEGVVAYVGELASYGNVIMIDHGNDLRSVILGNFYSTKKVNENVIKGEIIAKKNDERNNSLKSHDDFVYFEVRKFEEQVSIYKYVNI